jgi:hypothetical protein
MDTYESSGSLTSVTKSFTEPHRPNLDNLVYSLSGESITIDVVGSPGTSDEERVTQPLDGTSTYSIYSEWSQEHTDYRLEFSVSTSDDSTSPSFDQASLVSSTVTESGHVEVLSFTNTTETIPASTEAGSVHTTTSTNAVETSPASESASIEATTFLEATETAPATETASVQTTVTPSASEYVEMVRNPTLTADAAITSTQTLQPVFPDERSLDVQWDFSAEHMGFASEWLDEDSIIKRKDRDGVGVTIGGRLTTTIEVRVEYDKSGDGTADVTSDWQDLSQAYHTLAFDDNELFGEDGWYRVVVRGLRTYDTVNQLDIGAVHDNL